MGSSFRNSAAAPRYTHYPSKIFNRLTDIDTYRCYNKAMKIPQMPKFARSKTTYREIATDDESPKKDTKKVCPKCGSENIASIMYGLPLMNDKLKERIDAGEIVLGGCVLHDYDSMNHCNKCKTSFGRRQQRKTIQF